MVRHKRAVKDSNDHILWLILLFVTIFYICMLLTRNRFAVALGFMLWALVAGYTIWRDNNGSKH
jgi:hypothetical protein